MTQASTLEQPTTNTKPGRIEDPLVTFARGLETTMIGRGEQVIIPEEFRGMDPTTGRTRTRYAAKKDLRQILELIRIGKI